MYCIASRGQPTGCGPQAGGVGKLLKTPHRKNISRYEMFK